MYIKNKKTFFSFLLNYSPMGFCPSCKIHPGAFVLVVKFIQGLLPTLSLFDPGVSVLMGFCPYSILLLSEKQ